MFLSGHITLATPLQTFLSSTLQDASEAVLAGLVPTLVSLQKNLFIQAVRSPIMGVGVKAFSDSPMTFLSVECEDVAVPSAMAVAG